MISIIAAVARNGVIGKDNQLLWHLPEDMRHFRETTRGKPVIMGRKTWESLPDAFRPLPARHNIVVSRNPAYQPSGATLANSLEDAIRKVGNAEEIFIIGGADLYRQAMPIADRLYLTEIDQDFHGDVFFPAILKHVWKEASREVQRGVSLVPFSFVQYRRLQACGPA